MKRLFSTFALVGLVCGCAATRPASPPSVEQRLMQEGKLLYELGRSDEARSRLQILMAGTSDQQLRTSASYYLDRIEKGLPPEKSDPHIPNCWP